MQIWPQQSHLASAGWRTSTASPRHNTLTSRTNDSAANQPTARIREGAEPVANELCVGPP